MSSPAAPLAKAMGIMGSLKVTGETMGRHSVGWYRHAIRATFKKARPMTPQQKEDLDVVIAILVAAALFMLLIFTACGTGFIK